MSNYDDEQSEDGELARSPLQDEMDFSLSDEDRDNPVDALVIKPPQAAIRSHKDRRHKKSAKDRYKDGSRKEKKHQFSREREKLDKSKREVAKNSEREEYYREKQYYKEGFREKDPYREKDSYRDKEAYRDKDPYVREKDTRDKEAYREKEGREAYRDKELRDKDLYRERENYKDREPYREGVSYRDTMARPRDVYREKELYKERDLQRERDAYFSRETQTKYAEYEGKQRKESERIESRLRLLADDGHQAQSNEKENRNKTSGDKELEDLRSRLLSKRIHKEIQNRESKKNEETKSDKQSPLDKHQQERRKKLLEAEREMEKRKHQSRTELEARRQERRRRGKKRSVTPNEDAKKRPKKESPFDDVIVTVSDASDVEIKNDESEAEEGEHSNTETEDSSSSEDDTEHSRSEEENEKSEQEKDENIEDKDILNEKSRDDLKTPQKNSIHNSGSSHGSKRSRSRTKSRSRSRSHSFSPPPPDENGKVAPEEVKPDETDEQLKKRQQELDALPPYFPALQGCRSVEEFQCLNRIEEGTYGVVYRARDKTTEEIVALKRLKMEKEKEGFPITSLREINTLLKGQHPNIVTVREIVVGSNMDKIFIVMDYVEHDLKSLMETMRSKKQVFLPGEVKCLMTQLLHAVHHLHDNWILHRDLKTSNLLLSHKGILKVGDFGLAREYGSPLRQYTPVVVTLWYRAPELLLCCKEYSTPIDVWSVGCIFAELVTMNPLFPGKSEVDQLNRIFKELGTPSESVWEGYNQLPAVQKMTFADHAAGGLRSRIGSDLLSDAGHALLAGFLTYDPVKRITADAALDHAYFKEQPLAIEPAMFPTWPAKSEGARRGTHSPRPPAGGAAASRAARASPPRPAFRVHQPRSISVAPGFSLKF